MRVDRIMLRRSHEVRRRRLDGLVVRLGILRRIARDIVAFQLSFYRIDCKNLICRLDIRSALLFVKQLVEIQIGRNSESFECVIAVLQIAVDA